MEVRSYILAVIIGSGIVTIIPRTLPLMILSRFQLPEWAQRWLSHVPVAVMTALLAQELLLSNGKFSIMENQLELFAAIPAFVVALTTRSLMGTVVAGIVSMMAARFFI
ncbi:MAG: AzlD domain-containing protein [Bacillales bacterium]|nr:AzlD domain-containing protein [Bacillales bacterium]